MVGGGEKLEDCFQRVQETGQDLAKQVKRFQTALRRVWRVASKSEVESSIEQQH